MIAAMKDEARWTTENNPVNSMRIPYFPDYMYGKKLDAMKPGSVSLG